MENRNMKDESIWKLDVIWSKITRSRVSGYQNQVLRHILGSHQDGFDIEMISYIPDNSNATPEKLHSYLVGGIRKLITYAYMGVEKESKIRQGYSDTFNRLTKELENRDILIAQYKNEIAKYQEEIQITPPPQLNPIQSDSSLIAKLTAEKEKLRKERDHWQSLALDYVALIPDSSSDEEQEGEDVVEAGSNDSVDMEIYNEVKELNEGLLQEINDLNSTIQTLHSIVDKHRADEEQILPLLQKSVYQQQHQGKCITLEPSQIEGVIRRYLDGKKSHTISKEMGVSKTSINSIIRCEYRAVQSLEKVLKALHTVNKAGNWGNEKKEKLDALISTYERNLSLMKDMRMVQDNTIKHDIQSISDYLKWVSGKQSEKDD